MTAELILPVIHNSYDQLWWKSWAICLVTGKQGDCLGGACDQHIWEAKGGESWNVKRSKSVTDEGGCVSGCWAVIEEEMKLFCSPNYWYFVINRIYFSLFNHLIIWIMMGFFFNPLMESYFYKWQAWARVVTPLIVSFFCSTKFKEVSFRHKYLSHTCSS